MSWSQTVLLVAAGILGGLTGSIAGLASVATYPALLVAGLPPVAANVTNTVALVFNGIGSILGSRPELAGQRQRIVRLLPVALLGGVAGAVLLLSTPAEGFEKVVPLLLGLASLAILAPVRPPPVAAPSSRAQTLRRAAEAVAIGGICIYGGYFGAAAGVLLLALLLRSGASSLAHANATKNVVLGAANLSAAVIFACVAPVHWTAVAVLGLGCLIGSRLGPIVVRHAPHRPMRIAIGLAGLALAVKLGLDAY
ncbi:sulfite exporter TauE/SafE family protein [Mycolicibacterium sp. 018/SC-01/001]|uniref:sulfite exporter TauE/SafE family protein n=1 Tax=Mycolicibacterium sp. 018/SC-01/001 TaxID=2592069 RepID=UPI00163D52AA|nr:sulfite exporter TauE/SafE family protein [Mycolicibacterium sp. 018/SC-01/001]